MYIRQEFVDAYINYVFNSSVQEQFDAFSKGFHRVCGGHVLVCHLFCNMFYSHILTLRPYELLQAHHDGDVLTGHAAAKWGCWW